MELYKYKRDPVNNSSYTIFEPSRTNGIAMSGLSFASPVSTGVKENKTVYAQIFQKPESSSKIVGAARDLMILVHGFATRDNRLDNYYSFASEMARRGITSIFINLPYHLKRTPEGESSGHRLIAFDDIQTLEFFHQAVVDTRRLLDISEKMLGPSKIYLCGISMGCMISTIVLAFEDRIDKAALLIGGGNWEEIHWKGVLRYILNGDCSRDSKNKKRVECRNTYKNFPSFLEEFKKTKKDGLSAGLDNLEDLKKVTPKTCFLCDPMAFGHMVDPEKILMINSRLDLYFSRRSAKYLWNELGRPQIKWINNLHSSMILKKPRIVELVYDFFKS